MVMTFWRGPPPSATFRFFADSELTSTVQWKIADPMAEVFPLYHLFHSSIFLDRPSGFLYPVGEDPTSLVRSSWYPHSPFRGVCYQGTADQWAGKASVLDPIPARAACCQPPWATAGGLIKPGSASIWGDLVTLTVEEYSGLPTLAPIAEIDCDQASGLAVVDRGPGRAGLTLTAASATTTGVITPDVQTLGGQKTFRDQVVFKGTPALSVEVNGDPGNGALDQVDSFVAPTGQLVAFRVSCGIAGNGIYLELDQGTGGLVYRVDLGEPTFHIPNGTGLGSQGFTGTALGLNFVAGWCVSPAAPAGAVPTGPAGGALAGTYPNPTIGMITSGTIDGGTF